MIKMSCPADDGGYLVAFVNSSHGAHLWTKFTPFAPIAGPSTLFSQTD
jgi:hypothetical protein